MSNWSSDHGPWGPPGRTPAQATPPVASANWVYDNPNYAQVYPQAPMPTEYAFWGRRVVASLVDSTVALPYLVSYSAMAATIDYGTYNSRTGVLSGGHGPDGTLAILTLILALATFAFGIWNFVFRQGKTGSSIGKSVLGIRVVDEFTGQPIGPGNSFIRQLAHILDALACYIGYLFPLWESKRRTFADMIMKTVVVRDIDNTRPPY